jgi:hypothetical protein
MPRFDPTKVDVYGLGTALYFMLVGNPYDNIEEIEEEL